MSDLASAVNVDRNVQALISILMTRSFPVAASQKTGRSAKDWSAEKQQAVLALVWRDLVAKMPDVGSLLPSARRRTDVEGTTPFAGDDPKDSRSLAAARERFMLDGMGDRKIDKIDVMVACRQPKELVPTLLAFGIDPESVEDLNLGGRKVYCKELVRQGRKSLNVAVVAASRQRTGAGAVLDGLISILRPQAVILSGHGAGVRDKTHLGDVVVSRSFVDALDDGSKKAGDEVEWVDVEMSKDTDLQLAYFMSASFDRDQWRQTLLERLNDLDASGCCTMPSMQDLERARFHLESGGLIARDELPTNASVPGYYGAAEAILSCDPEASGFGQVCARLEVAWAMFRGIADHGDRTAADRWQGTASLAAGMAARRFLTSEFRLPDEIQLFHF